MGCTYNGQWILGWCGICVYVINTNNSFQLAIRTDNPIFNTNLFDNGNVVIYKTCLTGDKNICIRRSWSGTAWYLGIYDHKSHPSKIVRRN